MEQSTILWIVIWTTCGVVAILTKTPAVMEYPAWGMLLWWIFR